MIYLNDVAVTSLLEHNESVSTDEIIINLLQLYIRHKWTKVSLQDTLSLLQKIVPDNCDLPKSVFKLFQYIQDQAPAFNIIKHFYCKTCSTDIDIDLKDQCLSCNSNSNISFFFEIDICEQLQFLFEHRNLSARLITSLNRDENIITDISDGSEYIRVNSRPNRNKYDLTLVLNTDGISVVKSSKNHCWPLVFVIAELPEHLREVYMVTIGLWYDTCKPHMNIFLKPFCSKLQRCFHDGISWIHPETDEKMVSSIVIPLIIADAPARADIQNIVNFNGRHGCNICEVKMRKCVRVEGEKRCRIYPFNDKGYKLRNNDRFLTQGLVGKNSAKGHVKGVKSIPIISNLPLIDLGTCLIPEYMHSVLLGVVRQFLDLWFYKKGPWNIKKYSKNIDEILLNIKPPYFFNRMPRSITLLPFYKASEYYNWMLFYSLLTLVNFLPQKYFQHWLLLVKSLFMLLQDSIKKTNLELIETFLKAFVKEIKKLYGDRILTYNIHQLLHLPLVVKRWGPLFANSAFPFENYNGLLAHNIHGTKHIGQEIMNNLRIFQGINILKTRTINENITSLNNNKISQPIGKNISINLNDIEEKLLTSSIYKSSDFLFYSRAKINNGIYTHIANI